MSVPGRNSPGAVAGRSGFDGVQPSRCSLSPADDHSSEPQRRVLHLAGVSQCRVT